jgi:hypothetical protein
MISRRLGEISMTIDLEQTVVQRLRILPIERQIEVLDFIDFLTQRSTSKKPRRNPIGLFAGLGIDMGAQEIDDARAELWKHFPRDVEL